MIKEAGLAHLKKEKYQLWLLIAHFRNERTYVSEIN